MARWMALLFLLCLPAWAEGLFPYRVDVPLPGRLKGVLIRDCTLLMAEQGISGPPDAIAFSTEGSGASFLYVPGGKQIENLQVSLASGGKKTYPHLHVANLTDARRWGMKGAFALAEIEVNDGQGGPGTSTGFVATQVKILEFPVDQKVEQVRKLLTGQLQKMGSSLQAARQKAEGLSPKSYGRRGLPSGTEDLIYASWMAGSQSLDVRIRRTLAQTVVTGKRKTKIYPPMYPFDPAYPGQKPPPQPTPQEVEVTSRLCSGVQVESAYHVSSSGEVSGSVKEMLPVRYFEDTSVPL